VLQQQPIPALCAGCTAMLGYAEVEDVEMEDISAGDTMLPVPAPQGFLSGHSVRKLDLRYRGRKSGGVSRRALVGG
jgi:hypothetical protein